MTKGRRNILTSLSVLLMIAGVVSAAEVETKITAVTLYPSLAVITREGTVQLSAGENEITIPNLPAILVDESVRLSLSDDADVQIQNVRTDKWFLEKPEEQKIKQLQQQIEEVSQQIVQSQNEIQVLRTKEKFLASIQVASGQQSSQALAAGKMDAASWAATLEFLGKNLTGVYAGIAELEVRTQELKNKKEALQKQLEQAQHSTPKQAKSVSFVLQANKSQAEHLTVEYLLDQVSWKPNYEIRALPMAEKVELHYRARVTQLTGEDWDDVNLILSTASPARGAQAPELHPWDLSLLKIVLHKREMEAPTAAKVAAEESLDQVAFAAAAPAPSQAEVKGVSVAFNIAGKWNIPSGQDPVQVDIMNRTLPVKLSYMTIPKLSPFAYLRGVFANSTDYPLLSGESEVFVDGDYVGKVNLKSIAPGEEVDLSLGIDEGIKVKHELVKKFERTKGLLSKREEIEYQFKITLESFKSKPIALLIKDQMPRSLNEAIAVEDVQILPEPKEWNKDSGEFKWEMNLEPKKKTEITMQFVVSYPRGERVIGLF